MADFLLANKELIKARFRAQIESTSDGANDSSDFFASLVRRIDRRLASGAIDRDGAELLQQLYLETMMDHARMHGRSKHADVLRLTDEASPDLNSGDRLAGSSARRGGSEMLSASRSELGRRDTVRPLSEQDEQIIRLRASGLSHKAVAHVLGLKPATVRQRWSRLVRSRATIGPGSARAVDDREDTGTGRKLAS